MSDLVPASPPSPPTNLFDPLRDPAGGSVLSRLGAFAAQPPVRKALPWFGGVAGIGLLALTWAAMSPPPQRVLYSSLSDGERAEVVAALDQAAIDYTIDNNSGALSVGEDDLYRARMLVASNGALAAPESGTQLLDSLPMGASRTLEGDRLRAAQERELQLTIMEIDGVEAVRVHLAQAEKSVFVREDTPPKASVMLRMARGRQLSDSQVAAIANLVAASVPGLSIEDVRIVDQHGRLLSEQSGEEADRLELQARMEAKLRGQLDQLLTPMLGAGNFSSEIQVELDMDEVTSARESYDKEGAVRREVTSEAQTRADRQAIGVPGATTNTAPEAATPVPGAPQGTEAAADETPPINGESSASRTYELGREVAVSSNKPGGVKRLSVAVALSQAAMKDAKPEDLKKIEDLVAAATGADTARGDKVTVIMRPFEPVSMEDMNFWETPWFATILRNVVALLSVLLVLLLGVRPLLKILRGDKGAAKADEEESVAGKDSDAGEESEDGEVRLPAPGEAPDRDQLAAQVELAQRIVREKPDDALIALRQMLADNAQPQGEEA
ncbi:MAG: flagellar M-ring protein FliF [Sphingomonadaceae bacterium]|nr:flagellar M-ring protein FliF [Sphingomonadaceae bacterium]